MSVKTTADEKLDAAKWNIRDAYQSLAEIVVQKIWGYDEFGSEYKDKIQEAMNTLLNLEKELGEPIYSRPGESNGF